MKICLFSCKGHEVRTIKNFLDGRIIISSAFVFFFLVKNLNSNSPFFTDLFVWRKLCRGVPPSFLQTKKAFICQFYFANAQTKEWTGFTVIKYGRLLDCTQILLFFYDYFSTIIKIKENMKQILLCNYKRGKLQ